MVTGPSNSVPAVFARNDLEYNDVLGAFVCTKHGVVLDVNDSAGFTNHLRTEHAKTWELDAHIFRAAKEYCSEVETPHPLRSAYLTGTRALGQVLPKIEHLPVFDGQQCGTCYRVFASGSGFISHRTRDHQDKTATQTCRSTPVGPCQAIKMSIKHRKLFFIPVTAVQSSPQDFAGNSVLSIFLRRTHKRTFDEIYNSFEITAQEDFVSSFVSATACAARLEILGLDVSMAARLRATTLPGDSDFIRRSIGSLQKGLIAMFNRAASIASAPTKFVKVRCDFATPGISSKRKTFLFLKNVGTGKDTIRRYADSARIPIIIALRVFLAPSTYPKIPMGSQVRRAIKAFSDLFRLGSSTDCAPDSERYQQVLHDVLYQIFFESGSGSGSTDGLFTAVVYSSLCTVLSHGLSRAVPPPPSRALSGGEVNYTSLPSGVFGTATDTGSRLCGVMYAVTCSAIVHVYDYHGDQPLPEAYESTIEMLQVGAPVGLTLLVELRSICTSLRPYEVSLTEFHPCRDLAHGLCGATRQVELSTQQIGSAVKSMHTAIRKLMFDTLFMGAPLPHLFEESVDNMIDHFDEPALGYSALTAKQNQPFVDSCTDWVRARYDSAPASFLDEAWKHNALQVMKLLLAAMHLSAGSPGRGTEMAACHVHNTSTVKRTIYFRKGEIILIPAFDKRRALTGGKIDFISRHTDKETAFLIKSYLLLVRPWLLSFLKKESPPKDILEKYQREFLFTMGVFSRKKTAAVFGEQMKANGVNMNTSTYRHHHTGLLKLMCVRDNLGYGYLRFFGISPDSDDNDNDEEEGFESFTPLQARSLELAGHSVQTALEMYAHGSSRRGNVTIAKHESRIELNRKAARQWQHECCLERSVVSSSISRCTTQPEMETSEKAVAPSTSSGLAPERAQVGSEKSNLFCVPTSNDSSIRPPTCVAGFNGFTPASGLDRYIGAPSSFRCDAQKNAMSLVAANKSDVLVCLKTGGGKSAVVAGPILYEAGFTVWVAPLRALFDATSIWMSKCQISVFYVNQTNLIDRWEKLGNVILVTPEILKLPLYTTLLQRLVKSKLINRVVVDEAHLAVAASDYRPDMVSIGQASDWGLACRTVLLSATMPPSIVPIVAKRCGASPNSLQIVRGDPRRRNLELYLRAVSKGALIRLVCAKVLSTASKHCGSRCIVYCPTVFQVRELHRILNANTQLSTRARLFVYHGKLNSTDARESLKDWSIPPASDKLSVMLATEAFGCGLDYPDVRHVILAGGVRSTLEFWQQAGRAGRDGKHAIITLLYVPELMEALKTLANGNNLVSHYFGDFHRYFSENVCRRIGIELALGGPNIPFPLTCTEDRRRGSVVADCHVCSSGTSPHARVPSSDPGHLANNTPPVARVLFPAPSQSSSDLKSVSGIINGLGVATPASPSLAVAITPPLEFQVASETTDHHSQVSRAQTWDVEMHWLREISQVFRRRCKFCLLSAAASCRLSQAPPGVIRGFLAKARSCKESCQASSNTCRRCKQKGHWATACPNLRSQIGPVVNSKCAGCFHSTVNGRDLHSGSSQSTHCLLQHAAILCFVSYSLPPTRNRLVCDATSPYKRSLDDGNLKPHIESPQAFFSYLTEDGRLEDPAGFVKILRFLFTQYDLAKFIQAAHN